MYLINRDTLQERYNFYAQHYNESKNPVTASAELLKIKEGLQQRLGKLEENLDLYIDDIQFYLGEIYGSTYSSDGDKADDLLVSNHKKLIDHVTSHIKWEVHNFFHISHSEDFIHQNSKQIRTIYEAYDKNGQEQKSIGALEAIVQNGKKYEQTYHHLRGVTSVVNRIIDENYPSAGLQNFEDLDEQEQNEITEGYTPHHNTREDLIEDLKKILEDIQTKPRFFHKDGTIKHTTVAKYAVSQLWFAEKHGYGDRGLHEHIKKTYQSMKSSYSS